MKKIKIFLTLLIVHCTLLIGTASAQWWVQGGNLLWPYGDVTIQNDLNVEGNINGVKKYVALLTTQKIIRCSNNVFENTIGDIVWSYDSPGSYIGTLTDAFPNNKVICFATFHYAGANESTVFFGRSAIIIVILTVANSNYPTPGGVDGSNVQIEIRVYP